MPILLLPSLVGRKIDIPTGHQGHDLRTEIDCYSLPYGALGFVSHLLTYYTIACLWAGRSPLWPPHRVKYTKWDLWLGLLGMLTSATLVVYTLIKCRNMWELVVIAIWKLSMSLLNGLTAMHVATAVVNGHAQAVSYGREKNALERSAWWIGLYMPGMVAGVSGLISLVIQYWDHNSILVLTIVFGCIVSVGMILGVISFASTSKASSWSDDTGSTVASASVGIVGASFGGLGVALAFFTIFAALYSDWVLGMIMDNLIGLPTSDNSIFYWTYFVAKRLTMLCL